MALGASLLGCLPGAFGFCFQMRNLFFLFGVDLEVVVENDEDHRG